ncbi:peroxidasin-like [Amphiura filiformis]|uniref:peroxidasin-like n=1 Tax=Amphiura filiformis TaxID=82378 RepID=UPI003B2174A6
MLQPGATDLGGILAIPNVSLEDSGRYVCTGSNMHAIDRGYATLIVTSSSQPPIVNIEPRFHTVTEGDAAEFRCIAAGSPKPELRWFGGQGGVVSPDSSFVDGYFRIPSAKRSDEAEYCCEANNKAGTVRVRTVLYVTASKTPKVSIDPAIISINDGERAIFYCTATGDPPPEITCTRENSTLPSKARFENGCLLISNVDYRDIGEYRCNGVNSLGSSYVTAQLLVDQAAPSDTIQVHTVVHTVVQKVPFGGSVTIDCHAEGDPPPVVSWVKVDGELSITASRSGNFLTIPNVQLVDAGTYRCTATNVVGSQQSQVVLIVECKCFIL